MEQKRLRCRLYHKEHSQTTEYKKRHKRNQDKYNNRPDIKARRKQYLKDYAKLPSTKARKTAQAHIPEVMERKREYSRKYSAEYRKRLTVEQLARIYAERHSAEYLAFERIRNAKRRSNPEIRERLKECYRRYRSTERGKEKKRLSQQARLARLKHAKGTVFSTLEAIEQRKQLFGYRCYLCGAVMDCMDHVKPVSRGGWNCPSNQRPACRRCNSIKLNHWPYPPLEKSLVFNYTTPGQVAAGG